MPRLIQIQHRCTPALWVSGGKIRVGSERGHAAISLTNAVQFVPLTRDAIESGAASVALTGAVDLTRILRTVSERAAASAALTGAVDLSRVLRGVTEIGAASAALTAAHEFPVITHDVSERGAARASLTAAVAYATVYRDVTESGAASVALTGAVWVNAPPTPPVLVANPPTDIDWTFSGDDSYGWEVDQRWSPTVAWSPFYVYPTGPTSPGTRSVASAWIYSGRYYRVSPLDASGNPVNWSNTVYYTLSS